jgi:superfamily I DNA and/or RNA helicase
LKAWQEREVRFQKAYNAISDLVVREARIVVCTDNLAGCDLVRKNFAAHPERGTDGIIVIYDEDGQAVESNAWISIVLLNQAAHVKGCIRGGDRYQLPPLILSLFQRPGFNEFSPQLNRSLYDRLLRTGFPVVVLRRQHRMHPKLSNYIIYNKNRLPEIILIILS